MSQIVQLAVMGNPIAHSKSPIIHQNFAKEQNAKVNYQKLLVPIDDFAGAVKCFFESGGRGLNITVPFKEQALKAATVLTARAQKAGAINTLWNKGNGEILGDTTDGEGLVNDIVSFYGHDLSEKSILILGAGGAVKGVIEPILSQDPSKIVIANRTAQKAIDLANIFDTETVKGCGLTDIPNESFDWIINGTSASLSGEVPPVPNSCITESTACYDMMYSTEATAFQNWAKQKGIQTRIDGLGMLVEQAALSYQMWMDFKPSTQKVRDLLRAGSA